MLGRLARSQGEADLAQTIQRTLWESGFTPPDLTLDLARHEQDQGHLGRSVEYIVAGFGPDPKDPQARILLARALARQHPAPAIELVRDTPLSSAKDALLAIDAMRMADALEIALQLVEAGERDFPSDPHFPLRRARIVEALGDWSAALEIWQSLENGPEGAGTSACYEQVRLNLKLEHQDAVTEAAARHMMQSSTLLEDLRLALLLDQPLIVQALLTDAVARGETADDTLEWPRVARELLNHGEIGLLAHLVGRGLLVGKRPAEIVTSLLGAKTVRAMGRRTVAQCAATTSPECILPLEPDTLSKLNEAQGDLSSITAERLDYLLVNATLSAGGAERQFVVMVEAMLANGVDPGRIHVALFSLVRDRGHCHFLDRLLSLGVHVHDLRRPADAESPLPSEVARVVDALPRSLRQDIRALWPLASRLNPRVIHGWQDRASLAAGFVGSCLKSPQIVMSLRNMQPQKRGDFPSYTQALYSAFARLPNVSLNANSIAGARDYEAWLDLEYGHITTLHNGLNTEEYRAVARPVYPSETKTAQAKPSVTVGGVFRLAANKRPLLWLQTIAQLSQLSSFQISARIVGNGPFLNRVEAMAEKLGLTDLRIDSALSAPEEIYAGMDCLLLMSRVEGTPNVLLEAQACGIPVAACDVGGVGEAVWTAQPGPALILPADVTPEDAAQELHQWLPGSLEAGAAERQAFIEGRYGMSAYGRLIDAIHNPKAILDLD